MEVDEKKDDEKKEEKSKDTDAAKKDSDKDSEKKDGDKEGEEKKEEKKEEPLFEMLSNPARVMKAQLKAVHLQDKKYEPVKDISIGGVVLLDNVSGEKEEIVAPMFVDKGGEKEEDEGAEPEPPQPSQWQRTRPLIINLSISLTNQFPTR